MVAKGEFVVSFLLLSVQLERWTEDEAVAETSTELDIRFFPQRWHCVPEDRLVVRLHSSEVY